MTTSYLRREADSRLLPEPSGSRHITANPLSHVRPHVPVKCPDKVEVESQANFETRSDSNIRRTHNDESMSISSMSSLDSMLEDTLSCTSSIAEDHSVRSTASSGFTMPSRIGWGLLCLYCITWVLQLSALQLLMQDPGHSPSTTWRRLAPSMPYSHPFLLNLVSLACFTVFLVFWINWYLLVLRSSHKGARRVLSIIHSHTGAVVKRAIALSPLVIISGWLWFSCLCYAAMPVATAVSHLQHGFVMMFALLFRNRIGMLSCNKELPRRAQTTGHRWARGIAIAFTLLSVALLLMAAVPTVPNRRAQGYSKLAKKQLEVEYLKAILMGLGAALVQAVYELCFETMFSECQECDNHMPLRAISAIAAKSTIDAAETLARVGIVADDENITEEDALHLVKLISPRSLEKIEEELRSRQALLVTYNNVANLNVSSYSPSKFAWTWQGMAPRMLPFPPTPCGLSTAGLGVEPPESKSLLDQEYDDQLRQLEQPFLGYGSFDEGLHERSYNMTGRPVKVEMDTISPASSGSQSSVWDEMGSTPPFYLSDAAIETGTSFLYLGVLGVSAAAWIGVLCVAANILPQWSISRMVDPIALQSLRDGLWSNPTSHQTVLFVIAALAELCHNCLLSMLPYALVSRPSEENGAAAEPSYAIPFTMAALCGIPLAWVVDYMLRGQSSVNAVHFLAFFIISISAVLAAWLNADIREGYLESASFQPNAHPSRPRTWRVLSSVIHDPKMGAVKASAYYQRRPSLYAPAYTQQSKPVQTSHCWDKSGKYANDSGDTAFTVTCILGEDAIVTPEEL